MTTSATDCDNPSRSGAACIFVREHGPKPEVVIVRIHITLIVGKCGVRVDIGNPRLQGDHF